MQPQTTSRPKRPSSLRRPANPAKLQRIPARVVAAVAATLATTVPAIALDLTWDPDGALPLAGGSGTWNASTPLWTADAGSNFVNWSNTNPDNAIFNGPAGMVSLGETITAGTVTINTSAY